MAAQKKLMTKGQIVAQFAGQFELSKKAAATIVDQYAALAIAERTAAGVEMTSAHGDATTSTTMPW